MATTIPQVSLLIHFQLLHETLIFSESFTCLGISTKKVQCGRLIGTKAKKALSKLTWTTFRAIEENVGDIEQLLYEASFLVMCGYHQDQAEGQLKTWVEMGSSLTGQNSRHEHDVKPRLPLSDTLPSGDAPFSGAVSDRLPTEAETSAEPQIHDQSSNVACKQSSSKCDFEDCGYQSGDEDTTETSPAPPVPSGKHAQSSGVTDNVRPGPTTPKQSSSTTFTDSAISMSFHTPKQRETSEAIFDEEGPPSPLAGKTTKSAGKAPATRSSRPAPTPVQPKSSAKTKTIHPVPRKFKPFILPSEKLIQYIKKPLCDKDLEGYVYCFQVDNCRLNKIGHTAQRKDEKELQRSFTKRMKEHKNCGWHDAKLVGHWFVPHAQRVEKIIHYHFEARRKKETDMPEGSNGRTCKHKSHIEWFDVSLNEIWTVAFAWTHWITMCPYEEKKSSLGLYNLRSEWREKLDTLSVEREDCWLQWLCRYAPPPASVLEAVKPEISYNNGSKEQDEKEGSPVKISVVKNPEDPDDKETTAEVENANSHQLELVFRMKPSQTWPRKIQAAIGEGERLKSIDPNEISELDSTTTGAYNTTVHYYNEV